MNDDEGNIITESAQRVVAATRQKLTAEEFGAVLRREASVLVPAGVLKPGALAPTRPSMPLLKSGFAQTIERVRARLRGEERPVPIPWSGLSKIHTGGMWPGVHLLIGGTGCGKTQFALQMVHHAAEHGAQCAYVGLEMDELQIHLRMASIVDRQTAWSDWFTGRARAPKGMELSESASVDVALSNLEAALKKIEHLPVRCVFAQPNGWPVSELEHIAKELDDYDRQAHGGKRGPYPNVIVLDFLQLVGDEPADQKELRERIGQASYRARAIGPKHNTVTLLVSSTARDKYITGDQMFEACSAKPIEKPKKVRGPMVGYIDNGDALVGMAKESGETEFSADSVTVLGRSLHRTLVGQRMLFCGVVKQRYKTTNWTPLSFNGHRIAEDVDYEDAAKIGTRKSSAKGSALQIVSRPKEAKDSMNEPEAAGSPVEPDFGAF